MSEPQQPTDAQLDAYIQARLALAGVDLNQLPEQSDPKTGAPTRAQALSSLRAFVKSTPPAIAAWTPSAGGVWAAAYAQQASPPLEYPSITEAWTREADGR
ncbi:hypothetical protein ACWCQN_37265 [Streptomyces sp. NPDC001984]|uniref:hypothetical protein n=1 Tax=Streptomyces sp. NPDC002619 TaxID=3364655 RepID=UPI0036886D86